MRGGSVIINDCYEQDVGGITAMVASPARALRTRRAEARRVAERVFDRTITIGVGNKPRSMSGEGERRISVQRARGAWSGDKIVAHAFRLKLGRDGSRPASHGQTSIAVASLNR